MKRRPFGFACASLGCLAVLGALAQQQGELGFTDTPILPDQKWHVHDSGRPHPRLVTPGRTPGAPPSDAIVLFDGKDLSQWVQNGAGADKGKLVPARWKVENGYIEVVPGSGAIMTREKFGDCQLHIEWSERPDLPGASQERGNSGVVFMGRYELQVLDPYRNPTYADGQAGAIYAQWPPLVNPGLPPGEWQVYDVAFQAPRFENGQVTKPATFTVFFNGVLVHNRQPSLGATVYRDVAHYTPHDPELPISLQDHKQLVRFRNIWIRRVAGYDQPEK